MNDRTVYPLGKRRTLIVFAALILAMLVAALNQTIVATALPTIVGDLGGLQHYSWVFSAYMLGMTVTVPLYGRLSDFYGRRPFFALGILLFSAGSIVAGLAPSMEVLIAGRAIQGLGAGGLIPLGIAVIGDIIPPRQRGKWQGLIGVVFGTASVIGPATGGWIADNTSWRWAFFVSLPLAALALTVVWLGFDAKQVKERHRIDYLGATLLTGAVSTGLLGSVWGGVDYPWTSPVIVGLFIASALLAVAFVLQERRAPEPILPLDLFRNRTFAVAQVALFGVGAAIFGTIMFVPLFVQQVLGESATSSGAILTPLMLGWITASALSGQVVSRTGHYRPVLLAGPPIMATGFYLLAGMDPSATALEATRNVIIVGVGVGLLMQNFTVVVQNAVPRSLMGTATASTQFFRSIGATAGVTAMGAIMLARLGASEASSAGPAELANALQPAFALGILLCALTFVTTLFLPHTELRATMDDSVAETARAQRQAA
jgi:EmrB/QacA subfamily drug resistance transporter